MCVGASQLHGHKASMPNQNNIATNKIKMPQGIRNIVRLVMLILFKVRGSYITSYILIIIISKLRFNILVVL